MPRANFSCAACQLQGFEGRDEVKQLGCDCIFAAMANAQAGTGGLVHLSEDEYGLVQHSGGLKFAIQLLREREISPRLKVHSG